MSNAPSTVAEPFVQGLPIPSLLYQHMPTSHPPAWGHPPALIALHLYLAPWQLLCFVHSLPPHLWMCHTKKQSFVLQLAVYYSNVPLGFLAETKEQEAAFRSIPVHTIDEPVQMAYTHAIGSTHAQDHMTFFQIARAGKGANRW